MRLFLPVPFGGLGALLKVVGQLSLSRAVPPRMWWMVAAALQGSAARVCVGRLIPDDSLKKGDNSFMKYCSSFLSAICIPGAIYPFIISK